MEFLREKKKKAAISNRKESKNTTNITLVHCKGSEVFKSLNQKKGRREEEIIKKLRYGGQSKRVKGRG